MEYIFALICVQFLNDDYNFRATLGVKTTPKVYSSGVWGGAPEAKGI